ncbi:aldose epimerase family protein [Mucilaginibacter pedocola]|uniref:Aldose 1-epimerase n=1 Tax=Mucilaginibacter pedocola TaxID=1792845 RepID=A0A1S9PCP4_9SPHI|nr:aldose epimerase family protein [Mucilaginibacter pedocola]OOQ58752.1 hypothetical protein BC343_08830 [Mucilaginibacter pedocola]
MIKSPAAITFQKWGEVAGSPVFLFRLSNSTGAYAELTNYGATLVSAVVPDKDGHLQNVVLGYNSLEAYLNDACYLGSTVGRFANRIGGAKFSLDGETYHLQANDSLNTNHGGFNAFNTRVFSFEVGEDSVSFTLQSPDGDGGFPGNLTLTVAYSFTEANELIIDFKAITDKPTIANFTNHAYFNLSGKADGIFEHKLKVYADTLLDVDNAYIPSGLLKPVGKRSLNGDTLRSKILNRGGEQEGLNYCYVLNNKTRDLKLAAELSENLSARSLQIQTTYPAAMVYTGDHLHSLTDGNFAQPYQPFDGVAIECQYYPDSPNHAHFPSTTLRPGEEYNHTIVYKFGLMA